MLLLAVLALAIYLPFQSRSLDDFDSYNFAWALSRFDPADGIPHPPGYVLYVALGRLALALTGDPRLALTSLSAICAAISCGLLFALASTLFNRRVAWYAVGLVLLTPLMWLNANKALSDAPGLLAQTLCMFLTALAVRRRVPLWLAGLALGLAAGFRPQGVLGLALALLLAAVWLRARAHAWAATGLAVALGTLAWLLPLLAAFGWSIGALRTYLGGATTFVRTQESLFATVVSGESVAARWRELWFWSSQAVFAPAAGWLRLGLFLGTLAFIGIAGLMRRYSRGFGLCLAWCLPQALLHVLFLNASLTRYLLTFLFPVAMLVAAGLDSILPRRPAGVVVLAFMAVVGSLALPLARGLHTIPSPPEQLVAYVSERFPSSQTLIIARQSYNALAYHLPGWQTRFADYYGDAALERQIAEGQQTYVVIADPEALQPGEEYVEIETRRFVRDAQIHAKHAQVEVNVYGRASLLAPRDFALPETKTIQIGTPQDGKYVLDGWYRREEIGGVAARWTGPETRATLRMFLPQQDMTLTIRTWSFAPEQTVKVLCGDQLIGAVSVPQNWADVSVRLPASCIPADALTYIHLRPAVLVMPASDGHSTDRRTLGIAVAELRFTG